MHRRKRRAVRLEVRSEQDALAELALWERDPDAYETPSQRRDAERRRHAEETLLLTPELRDEFLGDLRRQGRSERHIRYTASRYLGHWERALAGKNLRSLSLREIQVVLGRWEGAQQKRRATLKTFYGYLRGRGLLATSEDPTFALEVPRAKPAKNVRERGYSMPHVEGVYAKIRAQPVRDIIVLRCKTGMHGTELERVFRGEGRIRLVDDCDPIRGTLTFRHKSGEVHVSSLDAQALAAAQRLMARKRAPADTWVRRHLAIAARKAGVPPIAPGLLRHSFISWSFAAGREVRPADRGVPLANVAHVVGHRSPVTTRRYYLTAPIPPMIELPLNLTHPDDPPLPVSLLRSNRELKGELSQGKTGGVEPPSREEQSPPSAENRVLH